MSLVAIFPIIFSVLLIAAAYRDVRSYRIPNRLTLGILSLYPLFAGANALSGYPIGAPTLATDVLVAAAALAICFALFATGLLGGGDAKLIPVVCLWVGAAYAPAFLLVMTLAGGGVAITYWIVRRQHRATPTPGAASGEYEQTNRIPYGIAIAAGGLFAASQLIINGYPAH